MLRLLKKLFGTRNDRYLRQVRRQVEQINQLEAKVQALPDHAFAEKITVLQQRAKKESLDALLVETFALTREAAKRVLGQRHFDVQLIGGIALHQGKIAEMGTGEGKTLAATLPATLNALTGKGVHIVTVNPYLAKRDAEWMGRVYRFLGLSVGTALPEMDRESRQKAYQCDITYGTNNEFGFDYLRDNMVNSKEDRVQGEHAFAIIDEVDSVLISEARTPLIISGPVEDSPAVYARMLPLTQTLQGSSDNHEDQDFIIHEKEKQIHLTDQGHQKLESLLIEAELMETSGNLYDPGNAVLLHYASACLKAEHLFRKDVAYIVRDEKIIIIDEHTGRSMPGRRWSEGIHQAIEAKEGLNIHHENQTLASITLQNFFRLYDKLAGMTGTADTEAEEFMEIYRLETIQIPTNRPRIRQDLSDRVYLNQKDKYAAIVEDIQKRHQKGQPVLVGTCSIESSEFLSDLLKKANITHEVLNAKNHAREADIIAQAGCKHALTISTNMAGRGTDIILAGNLNNLIEALGADASEDAIATLKETWKAQQEDIRQLGGLHVIGTERNESRRIDNQLIGRSGRQGDPGSSQFYLALDDHLLRIFAADKMQYMMKILGMKQGDTIEAPMLTNAIKNAQKKVEAHYFDIRKQLLKYDDIANEQRQMVYQQRAEIMYADDIEDVILDIASHIAEDLQSDFFPWEKDRQEWRLEALSDFLSQEYKLEPRAWPNGEEHQAIHNHVVNRLLDKRKHNYHLLGKEQVAQLEKQVLLATLDYHWKEHLLTMDTLRQGIHFRGYAQKNPEHEYKKEALELFRQFLSRVRTLTWQHICHVEITPAKETQQMSGYQVSMNEPSE